MSASSARVPPRAKSVEDMKKRVKKSATERPMRREYDFRGGVRGKYADRFPQNAVAVVLDPDVAAVFRNAESVNQVLRVLLRLAQDAIPRPPIADRVAEGGSNQRVQRTGSASR